METKTAAMSDATVRQMISLLKDPVFCGLRVLADERPLTREEFEMLAMPEGVSREQAWDILNALRRQTAVELPFRDGEGRRGWYYPRARSWRTSTISTSAAMQGRGPIWPCVRATPRTFW